MSPIEGSAAAYGTAQVALWGSAWVGSALYSMFIPEPSAVALAITVIGVPLLAMFDKYLRMQREDLAARLKIQESAAAAMLALEEGSLRAENDRIKRRLLDLEERDRKQDQANADQTRLIGSQNFELGQLRTTIADLRRLSAEKDETNKTLSLAILAAKGFITHSSVVVPSFVVSAPGAAPGESGPMGIVTAAMAAATAPATAAPETTPPHAYPPGTTTVTSETVTVTEVAP